MVKEWIVKEFAEIELGDKRLNKRVLSLLDMASKQPQSSLNTMFHTRKEIQACYRFFSNDLVTDFKILKPHLQQTQERVCQNPVVLCPSDTTSLNYTTRKTLKDSGYISSNNAQGFFMHTTIAITPDRLHLGIIDQKFWARAKEKTTRSSKERERMMLDEKESYRWLAAYRSCGELSKKCPKTQFIYIADREGDIFELFYEKEKINVDYIIRSKHNRTVYPLGEKSNKLLQAIENSKKLGEISFEIIKREDGSKRCVHQTIQTGTFEIKSRYGADTPLQKAKINVVYLKEFNTPEGGEPIVWRLLTSLPISTQEDVETIIRYYLCRWEIEVLFQTFKSGCKIEEKSLRSADRLYPLFNLFLIIAWRVNFLLHMSRITPSISCAYYFEESEWRAGYMAATRNKEPLNSPPTLSEMMGYIARLGGHLGRKKDLPPGVKAIWVGICKLHNYADAWDLFGPGAKTK
jgi:Transposase DNA-binding/Transposase Tn5 dimerisation domain